MQLFDGLLSPPYQNENKNLKVLLDTIWVIDLKGSEKSEWVRNTFDPIEEMTEQLGMGQPI